MKKMVGRRRRKRRRGRGGGDGTTVLEMIRRHEMGRRWKA